MFLFEGYPSLEDGVVLIHGMSAGDAPALGALASDAEVYRYLPTFLFEQKYPSEEVLRPPGICRLLWKRSEFRGTRSTGSTMSTRSTRNPYEIPRKVDRLSAGDGQEGEVGVVNERVGGLASAGIGIEAGDGKAGFRQATDDGI